MVITKDDKIVLALLPNWAPLIPPMGIAALKSYLKKNGYSNIKIIDANIEDENKSIYSKYFSILEKIIPEDKKGNIYNIGNVVWQDHAIAKVNSQKDQEYFELIRTIIGKTFFTEVSDKDLMRLDEVMEEFYSWLELFLRNMIEEEDMKVLGLSIYSDTLPASLFAFRLVKKLRPDVITVMGGGIFSEPLSIGSDNYNYFLENTVDYIDKILVGEGELLWLRFLEGKLDPDKRVYTLDDLAGETLDISELEVPNYDDLHIDQYLHLSTFASRSCIFQCSFCSESNLWGKYRKKSPEKVMKELVFMNEKYGTQLFLLGDSLLNPVINGLSIEMKKVDTEIYWDGYLRADAPVCDTKNTMLWREGGFYRARLGIESGSDKILKLMGKKITTDQIKSALISLAYSGIKTTTYWVIGYPEETEEDFQDTLNLIEELKDYIYEADCNPFQFFPSGQNNSKEWRSMHNINLLYPEKFKDKIFVQTWYIDCEPNREEIYSRVNRFTKHCRKLGISNPYTIQEIYMADERWKKLSRNAVPSLMEILEANKSGKQFKSDMKLVLMEELSAKITHDGAWGF